MSKTLEQVLRLIQVGNVRISEHGYEELADEDILVRDVVTHSLEAVVVEDYADYAKGPCVSVLQKDLQGRSLHVVWGKCLLT